MSAFREIVLAIACGVLTACSSPSGPIRALDAAGPNFIVPPNFQDHRAESSKRTRTDRNKTYYGDDTIVPDIATQLWIKLEAALQREGLAGKPAVMLKEAEVVVTLPRAEDAAMGGPLVWLADRKYLLVNIHGTVNARSFSAGVYKKQFSWPDESDIAHAVDEATSDAVARILIVLKTPAA